MSTLAQRQRALASGNKRRYAAHDARLELATGKLTFERALDDPRIAKQPIWRIVEELSGIGPKSVRQIIGRAGIRSRSNCSFALRPVRELTLIQREALIDEVARCPRRKPSSERRAA